MANQGQKFTISTASTTTSGLGISYDAVNSNITFGYGHPKIRLQQYALHEHMDLCNNGIDICGNNGRISLTSDGFDICGNSNVSLAALSTLEGLSGKISDNFVATTGDQDVAGTKTFSSEIQGSISNVRNGVYTISDQDISGTKTFTEGIYVRDISFSVESTVFDELAEGNDFGFGYAASGSFVKKYVDAVINDINELKPATVKKIGGVILPSGENLNDIAINGEGVLSLPNVLFKDITGKPNVSSQTISGSTIFTDIIHGDLTGNSGTVTDGVYLSGDQEITGSKKFTNTLRKNAELDYITNDVIQIDISSIHYLTDRIDTSYSVFTINNNIQPILQLTYGNKYRFIQDISFSLDTPLQFYTDSGLTQVYSHTTISSRDISVAEPPTHVTIDLDLSNIYAADIPAYLYYDSSENNSRQAGNKIFIKGSPALFDTYTTQTVNGIKTFNNDVNFNNPIIAGGTTVFNGTVQFAENVTFDSLDITAPTSNIDLTTTNEVLYKTEPSDNNSNRVATTEFVKNNIELLKADVGVDLDTLKELADAIGNDANFFLTIDNSFNSIIGDKPTWSVTDPSTITLLSAAIYDDASFGHNIDVSINTKVSLTGNELITGVKTFNTGVDVSNLKIINPNNSFNPSHVGKVLMYNADGSIDLCANTIMTPHERIAFTDLSNEGVRTLNDVPQTITGVKTFTEDIIGDISGALRAPTTIMGGHIIPDTHEQYDIGAAGNKIRHIFISDNSLWIGENHKINVSGGKIRFKNRDINKPPYRLRHITESLITSYFNYQDGGSRSSFSDISASGWLEYARQLSGYRITDIPGYASISGNDIQLFHLFGNSADDAWEDDDETLTLTDKTAFMEVSNNAVRIDDIEQSIQGTKIFSGAVDVNNLKVSAAGNKWDTLRNRVLMINDNYELDISADVNSGILIDENGNGLKTTHRLGIGGVAKDAADMLMVDGRASITDVSANTITIVGTATAGSCPDNSTDNTTNIATTHFVQNVSGDIYTDIATLNANTDISFGLAKDRTDVSFGLVDTSFGLLYAANTTRANQVDASFNSVENTFSALNTSIDQRSNIVDTSFQVVDTSFQVVDASFQSVATTFTNLNNQINARNSAVDTDFGIIDASLSEMVTALPAPPSGQDGNQEINGKKTFKNGIIVNPDKNSMIVFEQGQESKNLGVVFSSPYTRSSKLILGEKAQTTGHVHLGSTNTQSAGIIYDVGGGHKCIFYTQNENQVIYERMQFDNASANNNVEFFGDVSLIDPNRKFMGDLQGNASTASLSAQTTALETPRTIAGQAFDGTQNVVINMNDLNNVNHLVSHMDGYPLIWDDPNNNWATGTPVLATSATQLETSREIAGQSFNGTQDIIIDLDDLSGVDVSGDAFPNDGQALVWNDLSGVWMPGNVVSSGGGGGGGGGIWNLSESKLKLPNSIDKMQVHDADFTFSGDGRIIIDKRTGVANDSSYSDVLIPASSSSWLVSENTLRQPTDISFVNINDARLKLTGRTSRLVIDLSDSTPFEGGQSQDFGWDVSGANIIYNGEGNVGIGTADPSANLDVSGTLKISNDGEIKFEDTTVHSNETWFGPSLRGGYNISGGGWYLVRHSRDGNTFVSDTNLDFDSNRNTFVHNIVNLGNFDRISPVTNYDEILIYSHYDSKWWVIDYGVFDAQRNVQYTNATAMLKINNGIKYSHDSTTSQHLAIYRDSGGNFSLGTSDLVGLSHYDVGLTEVFYRSNNTSVSFTYTRFGAGISVFVRNSNTNPQPYPTLIKKETDHLHITAPVSIYPGNSTYGTDGLIVTNEGYVGIGTISPEEKLHIKSIVEGEPANICQTTGAYYEYNAYNYCEFTEHHTVKNESKTMGIEYDYWTNSGNISTKQHTRMHFISNNGSKGIKIWDTSTGNHNNIMTIASEGFVGIGTTTPEFPLDIRESVYYDIGQADGTRWDDFRGRGNAGPTNDNVPFTYGFGYYSMYASNSIWCQTAFVSSSDSRSKTDISNIDDDRALQQVNRLESKEYHYIDPERRRPMKTIGFIAQEVKEVIPNAVSLQKNLIPDELRIITCPQWDNCILTIPDLDMSANNFTGKCKFYVSNDPSGNDEVCKEIECVKDASGNKTNQFRFEEEYVNVFFYGKEVNDFHALDKNQIFALHHSAIQELSRKNDRLEAENVAKTTEIAELQAENVELKNEISLIKQHLGI